ncbi:MAG: hypothetical protein IJB97_07435, partial [Clostridia bacterium]|nr:hypothetical protein [Clostridia bacterium]
MMKKNLWTGILSVVAGGCFCLGAMFIAPSASATANAAELPTVQSVYADFDMRSTTNTTDETYYRSDLSYYANGNATVNNYGRYFDCNNYGVWEIPFTETSYERVQVDCSIKTVWKIYVSIGASECSDIDDLTWTLGAEYTDDNNRYTEFQNIKSDVTSLLNASAETEKSIYVKICDPSTNAGNGPQIRHMRVYVDKMPDITLTADETGSVPVGSSLSVFDTVNLKIEGIDGVEATSVSATIEDEEVLSYADGKFMGVKAGTTSVTLSFGGETVESEITVGGFLIANNYQATSAAERAIFRSELSGSSVNDAPARYFDKTNIGVWEIPFPEADFSFATLSMTMSAFWNLEIGVGEPNATDLTNITMTNVSSNLATRAERTTVRFVLSELLTGDLSGKSLYIRVSDPTTSDGNGPQVFNLSTLFRYTRAPKAFDFTLPEGMSIGVGEAFKIPVTVESEPNAKYELSYSANDEKILTVEDGVVVGKKQGTAQVTAVMSDASGKEIATKTVDVTVAGYALKESFKIFDGTELPYMDGTSSGYWREDLSTRRANNPDKSMLDMLDYNHATGLWYRYFDCEATGVWEFPFTNE